MDEKMDHLEKAVASVSVAMTADNKDVARYYYAQLAIAHALIALVERLDRVTTYSCDGAGAERCAIEINTPFGGA